MFQLIGYMGKFCVLFVLPVIIIVYQLTVKLNNRLSEDEILTNYDP
jgi:hypothetical protein